MRIAYFTNQYPAVSHTFIRREIQALEALDVTVVRYALWSTDKLVHPEDETEQRRTRFVCQAGSPELVGCMLTALKRPFGILRMLAIALKMGYRSDRGLLRHLAYAVEGIVLAAWSSRDRVEHVHAHF